MNLKNILTEVAPFIGSLFGSPLAGVAVKALGEFFFDDEEASQEKIEKELSHISPESLVKLKQLDAELKKKFIQAGLDEKKIAALDRESARERQIKTKDHMPAVLSILLTLGFFSIIFMVMFYQVPKESINLINIMIGAIGTAWTSSITYYFGSSSGSKLKSHLLGSSYASQK